jgi:GNAT superfamily N-acetyltransferase
VSPSRGGVPGDVAGFDVKPLSEATWPDFAGLVERHDGVWGGCWCMSFHAEGIGRARTAAQNRADKQRRVREGRAHAALVYDGTACVGWCQFGPTAELPRIKNGRAYREGLGELPDWRITCFFVDKARRGRGVASAALAGALQEIVRLGGGAVESYPDDLEGRRYSGAFLHNGTVAMFERQGFVRVRRLGTNRWVVARTVAADASAGSTSPSTLREPRLRP